MARNEMRKLMETIEAIERGEVLEEGPKDWAKAGIAAACVAGMAGCGDGMPSETPIPSVYDYYSDASIIGLTVEGPVGLTIEQGDDGNAHGYRMKNAEKARLMGLNINGKHMAEVDWQTGNTNDQKIRFVDVTLYPSKNTFRLEYVGAGTVLGGNMYSVPEDFFKAMISSSDFRLDAEGVIKVWSMGDIEHKQGWQALLGK